jgi:hypothetical protein
MRLSGKRLANTARAEAYSRLLRRVPVDEATTDQRVAGTG